MYRLNCSHACWSLLTVWTWLDLICIGTDFSGHNQQKVHSIVVDDTESVSSCFVWLLVILDERVCSTKEYGTDEKCPVPQNEGSISIITKQPLTNPNQHKWNPSKILLNSIPSHHPSIKIGFTHCVSILRPSLDAVYDVTYAIQMILHWFVNLLWYSFSCW